MRSLLLPALVVPVLVLSAGPVSAAPVETWTDVQHNVVFTDTFPDDDCGPRATLTLQEDRGPRSPSSRVALTSTSPGCTGCVGVLDWQFDGRKLLLRFDDSKRHPDIERLMIEHVYTRTG